MGTLSHRSLKKNLGSLLEQKKMNLLKIDAKLNPKTSGDTVVR